MWSRLKQMLIKEFIQVFRDKRTRFVLFVPPIVQMVIFGYAATFEIHHVPTAVLDLDHSQESRALVSRFAASGYFDVGTRLDNRRQLTDAIDSGTAMVAIQIHPGFAERLHRNETARIQVVVDGTNSNTTLLALSYIGRITDRFARDVQRERLQLAAPLLAARVPEVTLEERPWFNPNLKSQWFFVPGVIGSLTLLMAVLLTAFSIVREREIGTLEQVMVTPIRRFEFILGKTLPFFLIALADVVLIGVVGTFWFRVPFRGQITVLFLGAVLFLLSQMGVGLFISTVSRTQQQAMVSAFFFNMPAITFSGFGFPISSMPPLIQKLSYLDPLRYFLVVLRGVYLKGVGVETLWPQMAAMTVIGVALLGVSVLRFHKSLD